MFMYFGLDMYCTRFDFVIFTVTHYIHEKMLHVLCHERYPYLALCSSKRTASLGLIVCC
jgi:hypothetical protein